MDRETCRVEWSDTVQGKKSGDHQLIHDFDRARVNIWFMSGIRVDEMMKLCQVDLVNLPHFKTFFHTIPNGFFWILSINYAGS